MKLILVLSCFLSAGFGGFRGHQTRAADTNIAEVPSVASIEHSQEGQYCGGSIVGKNVVVTTANCIDEESPEDIQVRVGSDVRNKGGEVYKVKEIIPHPSWCSTYNQENDVAVLILEKDIVESDHVKITELVESEPAEGSPLNITGWHFSEDGEDASERLQSVVLPILNREECKRMYEDEEDVEITEDLMCSAKETDSTLNCCFNKGSPAFFEDKLAGIMWSFGPCFQSEHPVVQISMGNKSVRDFINEYIRESNTTDTKPK